MIHEIINILSTSITPKNELLLLYLHCINVINVGSKLKVGEGGGGWHGGAAESTKC